ncbi:MAG: uracil-DNA glycosylase [Pseudomonadota bacterium]
MSTTVKLEDSWLELLGQEFDRAYMRSLSGFLREEIGAGKKIYPPGRQMFAALDATPVADVKVVIIGQDPYHGAGQAHGLCFSVPEGVAPPPSLVNIYKEIQADVGGELDTTKGTLTGWARQGVLLLNSVLSVEHGRAGSHQGRGWEQFTDSVVARLNETRRGLVYLLWGSYAQKKGAVVDRAQNCVLSAPHPSPLSAHRGFLGCKHFSQANSYLQSAGKTPINWTMTA